MPFLVREHQHAGCCSKMYRAGWIGLLVQDGLCAGNLNLHSKDLTTPCNSLFPLPLSLCDHHIRLSPASLQNSTSSTPAQQPDTCSQCFFSRIRGWRASATSSCKMADGACRWRFESKCECFPVAQNVQLYLQPLLPRALCLTIITASIHLYPHHFLRFRSYASGFMLKKTQGRSPFHTPVDPVQLLLTASPQALILKHRIPIHKIIVTMMPLR